MKITKPLPKRYTYEDLPCPSLQRQAEAKYDAKDGEPHKTYSVINGNISTCLVETNNYKENLDN